MPGDRFSDPAYMEALRQRAAASKTLDREEPDPLPPPAIPPPEPIAADEDAPKPAPLGGDHVPMLQSMWPDNWDPERDTSGPVDPQQEARGRFAKSVEQFRALGEDVPQWVDSPELLAEWRRQGSIPFLQYRAGEVPEHVWELYAKSLKNTGEYDRIVAAEQQDRARRWFGGP